MPDARRASCRVGAFRQPELLDRADGAPQLPESADQLRTAPERRAKSALAHPLGQVRGVLGLAQTGQTSYGQSLAWRVGPQVPGGEDQSTVVQLLHSYAATLS